MSKYDDLVKKLKEIFQIDKPELDFGIYRILNVRVNEINDYLENQLKAKVHESLAASSTVNVESLRNELKDKESQYRSDGIDPNTVPRVRELKQKLDEQMVGTLEHENAVFSHLLTFFSRYYDSGDFISQRRYKGNTYSIPYAGEEVMLHWANKDQYYIKNGENFSNYGFKLDDGRAVRFHLVDGDTAKDNRKDNGTDRRFVLIEPHTRIYIDDEGNEHEELLLPVEEVNGELILRFKYMSMPKGTKQDFLVLDAVNKVLNDPIVKSHWQDLSKLEPTEKNPQRILLEKCLVNFTNKNTMDYFIHKDLGFFLRSELDFYIKNEVMHLDDVQNAEKFSDVEKNLLMIRTLRAIALDLISFLSQLENFQKKLWLKKKFVVSTHYCITLDRVPEKLYPVIAANKQQWQQWKDLGVLDDNKEDMFKRAKVGTVEYMKENSYLMVDTTIFDMSFKYALLAAIDNLDETLDGLLIHGDNFQALNLLQERYHQSVQCVHIDPPYNTATSGFLYKNQYQHSSWLSFMWQTTVKMLSLLEDNGVFQTHIDENEYENIYIMLREIGLPNCGTIIWDKKNPMLGRKGVATQHEYVIWCSHDMNPIYLKNDNVMLTLEKAKELITSFGGVNDKSRHAFNKWINSQENFTGGEKAYRFIDNNGSVYRGVAMGAPELRTDPKFHKPLIHPTTGKPCPVPPNGWSRTPETFKHLIENEEILWGPDHTSQPQKKVFLRLDSKRQLSSVLQNANSGKKDMDNLGLAFPYCHPVTLYVDLLGSVTNGETGCYLDYFAGSGTTAHAVISLNRQDKGNRKYILIDQGDYFDSVLKSRLQKVVFSSDWRGGRARASETGISHAFKILKIESYEDTLNNLRLRRTRKQEDMLENLPQSVKEEYLLKYMLDIETSGSILSIQHFRKPFDYTLRVALDSAGASEECRVDLIETFNYLIGLRIKHIDMQREEGFVTITGWLPTGDKTLILWRDVEQVGYNKLNSICDKLAINPSDCEFDVVYINGDHNIPTRFTSTKDDGDVTKELKIRQIEPEFLNRMFLVEEG